MFTVATLGVIVALAVAVIRAIRGPTVFDRVLAANVIGTLAILLLAALGFLLGALPSFWNTCLKYRKLFFAVALTFALLLFINYYWDWNTNKPDIQDTHLYIYGVLNGIHIWTIILASNGYAMKYLNFANKRLSYLNSAVYPYYITHQAVIVASGYYVLQWDTSILVKLIVLIVICMLSIWSLYHFIIRRTKLTRLLFGMRWKR